MANLVEHTMLNGLEENLKSAIEMAGGEIPTDSCVWDYPGIIRDQLSSGGQVVKILPGKGIQVERDSKGNYIVSVENADTSDNIEINTIQAPSFAVGVEGGQWNKGTILQEFLEDLFSKVFPYVPSVKGGEIIEADEDGNDIFGYDEIDTTMEVEETPEAREATIAWETRQLGIMDWITNDVDWMTGECHPASRRLAWHN